MTVNDVYFLPAALALASFECEAPDNGPEKEHYKQLKMKWEDYYISLVSKLSIEPF